MHKRPPIWALGCISLPPLATRANCDIQDQVGRPCDSGQIGIVDRDERSDWVRLVLTA